MVSTLPHLVSLFIVSKRADGRAAHTIADYSRALSPFASWCAAQNITTETISRDAVRAYIVTLQARDWKPATIAIHVRNLRVFLHWMNVEDHTADNLALAVKAPAQTQRFEIPITADEIQALLNTCASVHYIDRRDAAMILVLCDTGLRTGELIRLSVGNWRSESNADGSYLLAYAPKSRSYRYACLGRAATAALADYLAMRPALPDDAPLFATSHGGRLESQSVGSIFVRRAIKAGLARCRCHPHIFRKAFVTGALDNGMDAERVRILAGWSSMAMLKVYADSSLVRLQEAHRRAGPVDKMNLKLKNG